MLHEGPFMERVATWQQVNSKKELCQLGDAFNLINYSDHCHGNTECAECKHELEWQDMIVHLKMKYYLVTVVCQLQ